MSRCGCRMKRSTSLCTRTSSLLDRSNACEHDGLYVAVGIVERIRDRAGSATRSCSANAQHTWRSESSSATGKAISSSATARQRWRRSTSESLHDPGSAPGCSDDGRAQPRCHRSDAGRAGRTEAFAGVGPRQGDPWPRSSCGVGRPDGLRVQPAQSLAAWQRGSNENTNGILRQWFPRSTDFYLLDRQVIADVQSSLYDRPLQTLGFRTPVDVLATAC
jgi:hypothetical protein